MAGVSDIENKHVIRDWLIKNRREFKRVVDHWHPEEMRLLLKERIISEITGNVVAYFLIQGDL